VTHEGDPILDRPPGNGRLSRDLAASEDAPGGAAAPQAAGVLGLPESNRRRGRVNSTARLNRAPGTARRMRSGVIRRPPGEFDNVEGLAQEDGGQGVLRHRKLAGVVDKPESTRRCRRVKKAARPDTSPGTARGMRSGAIRRPPGELGNVGDLAQEDGGQGVLRHRKHAGVVDRPESTRSCLPRVRQQARE
jgi:hypothetical protein